MAPRIQEYLPETGGAEPRGGTSPNLEAVTQFGEGLERFGRGVSEVANTLEERTAMMEAADAQANISDQKASYYDRIQEETKNGTINQQKIFDDYDSWASDQASQYSTPRGKAEFERAAARTRGMITRWSVIGKSQVDGANAVADHTNAFNQLSNLTQKDPDSWADNHAQLLELYNGYESDQNMNKNPAALQAMKSREEAQLAGDAVKGLQQRDFNNIVSDMVANGGKVDPRDPKYNQAQGMLDKGVFDDFLNADKKDELAKANRAMFSSAQTEGNRVLAIQKAKQEQDISDFQAQSVGKMAMGQMRTQDIVSQGQKLGMSYEAQLQMIKANYELAKLASDKKIKTPPDIFNEVAEGIVNGNIDSHEALMQYASKGLVGTDMMRFNRMIDKTPEGQINLQNEKQLLNVAKSTLVNSNAFLGKNDPAGAQKYALFIRDLQQAKIDATTKGEKISTLLDPRSKDYFGSKVDSYRLTPQEQLDAISNKYGTNSNKPTNSPVASAPAGKIYIYDEKGNRFATTQKWLDSNPDKAKQYRMSK